MASSPARPSAGPGATGDASPPPGIAPPGIPPSVLGLLAVLSVLWGLNFPMAKIALAEMPPWTFRTLCLAAGGVGILALARLRGLDLRLPPGERLPLAAVATLNITGFHLLSAYALRVAPAGEAVLLAYTMPLWAAVFAVPVLGERLARRHLAALALGLGGVALLIGPRWAALGSAPAGALLMIAAAVSWGAGTVGLRRFAWSAPTLVVSGWQILLGGIPVALGLPFLEPLSVPVLSAAAWGGLAYSMVVSSVVCLAIWFRLVAILPAGLAGLGSLGVPVVGVAASSAILGEPMTAHTLGGMACIVGAMAAVVSDRPSAWVARLVSNYISVYKK